MPTRIGWGEAWHLAQQLLKDPSAHLFAAVAEWAYPMSRDALVTASLYDLQHKVAAGRKKPPPYPRPWDEAPKRMGRASLPQDQIRAFLRKRGHFVDSS